MPIKTYRPITPTLRFQTTLVNDDLTTEQAAQAAADGRKRTGGRRNSGDLTIRHQGGGHKQKLRLIDFKREKYGVPGKVATIEYDPNRSARIALVHYNDGEKRYILQPVGLKVGMKVSSGPDADILVGNALPLKNIPAGTVVHAISSCGRARARRWRGRPGRRRSWSIRKATYALLKLPSGETRKRAVACMATVGQVGNTDHENVSLGKAGRNRWLGIRPTNRGVTMNPVDHPHGGGEGKTSGGRHPVTPVGPADTRLQDTQQQADRCVHRQPPGEVRKDSRQRTSYPAN
jgi:large subunit ribosomal protein L2